MNRSRKQRAKDKIIKKLGGWTDREFTNLYENLRITSDQLDDEQGKNVNLSGVIESLRSQLKDARDTLAGLQILKAKIETFRAEGTIPRCGRNEKQLKQRVEEKKNQLLLSLFNDILAQGRFVVIGVNEKPNKVELSAAVSILEGGVINAETKLPDDPGREGDAQEGNEDPQDD